jgi:hypothetical protein
MEEIQLSTTSKVIFDYQGSLLNAQYQNVQKKGEITKKKGLFWQ